MVRHCATLQIRLSNPAQYPSIVNAKWTIIHDKLGAASQVR